MLRVDGYDVAVVGAGAAGCALAATLSADPSCRVLLLEAGDDHQGLDAFPEALQDASALTASMPGSPWAWHYAARLADADYPLSRGRVVGGSTALNGAQFLRGTRQDYDGWGHPEWSYDALLPLFVAIERDLDIRSNLHGTSGPIPVRRARAEELAPHAAAFVDSARSLGFGYDPDMNAPESLGVGPIPLNIVDGRRINAAVAYLDPARSRPNLDILAGFEVRELVIRRTRVVGLRGLSGGTVTTVAADHVFLCAGAINTAHLLLSAGIGPVDQLRDAGVGRLIDLPVGQAFTDHPGVAVSYRAGRLPDPDGHLPLAQVRLNFTAAGSDTASDLHVFPYSFSTKRALLARTSITAGVRRRLAIAQSLSLRRLAYEARHQSDLALMCGLDQPVSRGALSLRSADPGEPPRIEHRYLRDEHDRRRLRECVRTAVEILHGREYDDLAVTVTACPPSVLRSDQALDRWIAAHLSTSMHLSGTCPLGPADRGGVVDGTGLLYGMDNLRIADTSVLPTITRRGPGATAMVVGMNMATQFLAACS